MKADFIEREYFELLLDVMREENALAVRVSLATGLRIGDVLALKPSNIGADGAISTICAKTGKPFNGKIPEKLAHRLLTGASEKWLFPSPQNREAHRTRQAVWSDIKKSARKCGISANITPHSARKVYAVETFHKKGLNDVQERLGHDRVETSLIYAFADIVTGKTEHRSIAERLPHEKAEAFASAFLAELGGSEQLFASIKRAIKKAEVQI